MNLIIFAIPTVTYIIRKVKAELEAYTKVENFDEYDEFLTEGE